MSQDEDHTTTVGEPEQRVAERTHLMYYLRVFDTDSNTLFGHVIDLSSDGMLITSHQTLRPKQRYRLMIEDVSVFDASTRAEVEAECRWAKEDPNAALTDGGFRFITLTESANELLANYVNLDL